MDRILITGAGSGIGKALAQRLAPLGHPLALSSRSQEKLDALSALGTVLPADLTTAGSAAQAVRDATAALGGLDVVVHCAGIGLIKAAAETTDAEFTRVLNVNTRATFLVAQAACGVMAGQKRGLFVTIPGILGKASMKNASAYVASKYAVTGMIKCLAQEYQRSGIRFSLLHFGGVDSPFWDGINMAVQRDKMIPLETAVDQILNVLSLPAHLVPSEVVIQPESHQLV